MLGVLPNSAPDSVDKGLELTQASTKEDFDFLPGDKDVSLILHFLGVLLLAEHGDILEKNSGK